MDIKKAQSSKTLLKDWWDDVVEYNFDTLNKGLEDEKKRSQDKDNELTQSIANEQEERKAADTSLQQKISDKIGFEETLVMSDGSKSLNWDEEMEPKIYSITADVDIPIGDDTGIMIIFKSHGYAADSGSPSAHLENCISQIYITGNDVYYREKNTAAPYWNEWSKLTDIIGKLESLTTSDKSSIVAAINEVNVKSGTGEGVDLSGYATKEELGGKADTYNSNNGFSGGLAAEANSGAALGYGCVAHDGGRVGSQGYVYDGGSVGSFAYARDGGAVGKNAMTMDGFAGGKSATTVNPETNEPIDAIQLGTGENNEEKTLQVYDYQLLDENGLIPDNRLSENIARKTDIDTTTFATKEELGDKADKATANGGFVAGEGASELEGTGSNISIGSDAYSSYAGVALGSSSQAQRNGIAIGAGTSANIGVSIGTSANTTDEGIQLGTGTNNNAHTFQVYSYQLLDSGGNIPSERIPQLNEKSDKAAIVKSEETAPSLEMNYNTEVRYGEVSSLTVTLPDSFEDDYISSVVFTSGDTAVNLIYPEEIKIFGEDCMDGIFTPMTNKRYTLILSYDGVYVSGVAGGVTI